MRMRELLLDLVEGPAVEIRHAGLDVEDRGDRAQDIFARGLLVIDEGLRQIVVPVLRRTRSPLGGDRGAPRVCLTRFRRKMPASTGVQGRKGMSQRALCRSIGPVSLSYSLAVWLRFRLLFHDHWPFD